MSVRPMAIGCMRLSTEPDRDDDRSIAVLHAALDAGVTLLDTADVYCWTDQDLGHNERLIARALAAWSGDRSAVTIATKGGLARPEGRWEPDGRAKHLAAACERSCRALDVRAIDLYQLHAVDPSVRLATSVRALDRLKRSGLINAIGLSNVTVGQIEEARRITEIASVQVELSVWHDAGILNGVAEYCIANGLQLLAHRPLGGRKSRARTSSDPTLCAIAEQHGVTPFEIALAWPGDLNPAIVPLPGVTRIETARAAARAQQLELTDDDRQALDQRFVSGAAIRHRSRPRSAPAFRTDAEVVLIMGLPGAGKSTLAQPLIDAGYQRLNRDEAGGLLIDLLPLLDDALAAGAARIVLDNTYLSRKSRAEVLRVAHRQRIPVRCVWLNTSIDDAQFNAAWRLVSRYGRLPDEDELVKLRKTDVQAFAPMAQFRAQRELEPPDASEGFSRIEIVPFERRLSPEHVNEALIVWSDGDFSEHAEVIRAHRARAVRVFGLSWRPGMGAGSLAPADAPAILDDYLYCPHPAGPPRCWCRKPLPGLGVLLIQRHKLDPARCAFVGAGAHDPGYARRLGFAWRGQ